MLRTLKKLYKINVISPGGLYRLIGSLLYSGINLMTLLRYASKLYPGNTAIVDEQEELTYKTLYLQARQLTAALQKEHQLVPKQRVAIVCRNHASMIRALFAAAYAGADVYLLNIEMSESQFRSLIERYRFDLIIHDPEVSGLVSSSDHKVQTLLSYHSLEPSIDCYCKTGSYGRGNSRPAKAGRIIVLSGGTTGLPKAVERRPGVATFFHPFASLLTAADLDNYKSVYIGTPVYHGFGLASVFISLLLGSKIFLLQKFNTEAAAKLIQQNKIDVITIVPVMLHRLLHHDPEALMHVSRIISGGAPLNPKLVRKTAETLGQKLFNLYGTSEAGFSIMATPGDLEHSADTIGKEIRGVQLKIIDHDDNEVSETAIGRICIKTGWSVKRKEDWIETGDLGYRDSAGYYFLCGRTDDMIISGGENVYPEVLERILLEHDEIKEVAVIGVDDEEFGQRLKAFIVANDKLEAQEIFTWLKTRAARYQVPANIELLDELPYTSVGKLNKKALSRIEP